MKLPIWAVFLFSVALATQAGQDTSHVYMRLNLNSQFADNGEHINTEVRNNNSWIGVQGAYSFTSGLDAVYKIEWGMNITADKDKDPFTTRPLYVGIRGKRGELTIGRNFTALWKAASGLDLFNHYEGDIKTLFKGENRLSDVVTYTSPKRHDVTFVGTYQVNNTKQKNARSAGLFYGDPSLQTNPVFAAVAQDFNVKGYDVTRLSFRYKLNQNAFGFMVNTQKPVNSQENTDTGYMIHYTHNLENLRFKSQYQRMEGDTVWNMGIDYLLSPYTYVYTWYSHTHWQNKQDERYLAVGIQHNFSNGFRL